MKTTSVAFGVFATAIVTVTIWLWPMLFSENAHYRRIVWHMRDQMIAAMPGPSELNLESLPQEERGRVEVIRSLQTAIANGYCERPDVSREKVRAIAEDLRRSRGVTLITRQGMYDLWAKLEDASPSLRDYLWITWLRDMQSEGIIPKNGPPIR